MVRLIFTGTINAIEPQIDPSTRTFLVQAEIGNQQQKLRPGMFVNTHLMLPTRDKVLTLPQAAVSYNPYGDTVFVVEEEGEVAATGALFVSGGYGWLDFGATRKSAFAHRSPPRPAAPTRTIGIHNDHRAASPAPMYGDPVDDA